VQVPVSKQTSMLSSLQMQRVSSKDLSKAVGSRDLATKASGREPTGYSPSLTVMNTRHSHIAFEP